MGWFDWFVSAEEKATTSAENLEASARSFRVAKQPVEAAKALKEAGDLYVRTKNVYDAIRCYREAVTCLERAPGVPDTVQKIALLKNIYDLELNDGRFEPAAKTSLQLAELHQLVGASNSTIIMWLERAIEWGGLSVIRSAQAKLAGYMAETGNYQRAADLFVQTGRYPDRLSAGLCYLLMDQVVEASELLTSQGAFDVTAEGELLQGVINATYSTDTYPTAVAQGLAAAAQEYELRRPLTDHQVTLMLELKRKFEPVEVGLA